MHTLLSLICGIICAKMSEELTNLEKINNNTSHSAGITNGDVEDEIKELAISYDAELKDFPQIREFVERLKAIIRRQQKKIKKLKTKLKDHVRGLVCQRSW